MWRLVSHEDYGKRLKKTKDIHRQEVKNVLDNLQAFLDALNSDLKPQQIVRGWLRQEPSGLRAIDESGPGKHKKALRLYVYPDEEIEELHVLTLGDKASQRADIKLCKKFVEDLKKKRSQHPAQDAPQDSDE